MLAPQRYDDVKDRSAMTNGVAEVNPYKFDFMFYADKIRERYNIRKIFYPMRYPTVKS